MKDPKAIVRTTTAQTAFLSIFEPKMFEGDTVDDAEYQCTLLFDDPSELAEVVRVVKYVAAKDFGDNLAGLKFPWMRGDDCLDAEGNVRQGFEGKIALKTKSKFSSFEIIDQKMKPIDSSQADRFQSGDYARTELLAKSWTWGNKRGVSLFLRVIQLVREGERFESAGSDLSGFEVLPPDPGATIPAPKGPDDMFPDLGNQPPRPGGLFDEDPPAASKAKDPFDVPF